MLEACRRPLHLSNEVHSNSCSAPFPWGRGFDDQLVCRVGDRDTAVALHHAVDDMPYAELPGPYWLAHHVQSRRDPTSLLPVKYSGKSAVIMSARASWSFMFPEGVGRPCRTPNTSVVPVYVTRSCASRRYAF